ncbi:MAG: hypothetical protein KAS39_06445, partial [Actinomycetia bacterium]|nr:hypothetical protein [Actinomycetes bacterium]
MVFGMIAIEKKWYIALGAVSFFYSWTYGGSFFLPMIGIIFFGWEYLMEDKQDFKMIVVILIGWLGGIIINPFFPNNLHFLYIQIFKTGLGASSGGVPVGNEWKPYDTWFFFKLSFFPLFLLTFSIIISLINGYKLNRKELGYLTIQFLFMGLYLKSRRFVEYWPLFAMIFSAIVITRNVEKMEEFAFDQSLDNSDSTEVISRQKDKNKKRAKKDHSEYTERGKKIIEIIPYFLGCALLLTAAIGRSAEHYSRDINNSFDIEKIEEVSTYLKNNALEEDIVFTDDWDTFPPLFLFNHKTYYIVGLDPTFMSEYDKDLYSVYSEISSGRASTNLERIKSMFKAKWVIVGKDHGDFLSNLNANTNLFNKEFDNEEYFLYKVL